MTTQSKIANVSPLLALMTAVDCHPVEFVRQSAKHAVEASVGESIVKESQCAIEKLLTPFADHPIEPLVLTPTDLWMIAVIQADASKRCNASNPILRIVGRDTFGSSGGVRLQGCISAERQSRVDRPSRKATETGAKIFFNDLHEWETRASVTAISRVTKNDTARGFNLIVDANFLRIPEAIEVMKDKRSQEKFVARQPSPPTSLSEVEQELLSALQSESHISPSRIPLSQLGLRLEYQKEQVALCSGSPESVIRSTAAFMRRGVLILQSTRILGVMLLGKGDEDVTCFRCHDSIEPDWTTATLTSDAVIDDRLKCDIAHWCGPHSSWVTTDFLESIATDFVNRHG